MREVRRPLPDGHRHETLVRLYLDEGETLSPLSLLAELMLASHPLALRCFLKGRIINIDWTAMARLAAIDGNHKAATVALPEAWFFDYVLGYHMKVEFFPRGVVGYRHADADPELAAFIVSCNETMILADVHRAAVERFQKERVPHRSAVYRFLYGSDDVRGGGFLGRKGR